MSESTTFDIFLSHARIDAELVLGVKAVLEGEGLSVYVDWLTDPRLDRTRVTAATADVLRIRMDHCRYLLYACTPASSDSKWMPWELGYFDGRRRGKVGILPIVSTSGDSFVGQEYLGLYPQVERINFDLGGPKLGRRTSRTSGEHLVTMARS